MRKRLSPAFVFIVILIALALSTLYFMARYRAHEAAWRAESAALQRERDFMQRSGRDRVARRRFMRRQQEGAAARPAPGRADESTPSPPPTEPQPEAP